MTFHSQYLPVTREELASDVESQRTSMTTASNSWRLACCIAVIAVASGALLVVLTVKGSPPVGNEVETLQATTGLWWWLAKPSNQSHSARRHNVIHSSNHSKSRDDGWGFFGSGATLPPTIAPHKKNKTKFEIHMPTFPPIFSYAPDPASKKDIPSQPVPVPTEVTDVVRPMSQGHVHFHTTTTTPALPGGTGTPVASTTEPITPKESTAAIPKDKVTTTPEGTGSKKTPATAAPSHKTVRTHRDKTTTPEATDSAKATAAPQRDREDEAKTDEHKAHPQKKD